MHFSNEDHTKNGQIYQILQYQIYQIPNTIKIKYRTIKCLIYILDINVDHKKLNRYRHMNINWKAPIKDNKWSHNTFDI